MNAPASPRYFAFISYSHHDELWASWLHKALETYRVPSRLVGQSTAAGTIPRRLLPIFRDRDELASATDLSRKVNAALAHSHHLIVICSPQSAASRWVDEEILAFKRLGGSERIFCLIVAGEPNASGVAGREAEECFAPALRHAIGADGQLTHERTEPIAADAREGKDGRANAKLKLIAGLLDVGFDALKQRELQRRNRRMAIVTAAALLIMAITTTLAITALIARHDAERRQKQAEDLVNFMLGDLNDKLHEVSRLDIMEAVDDRAMTYFKSLPKTDVTSEALQQRAKAFEKIGSVRLDQGHLPAAMDSYNSSLELLARLVEADPANAQLQSAQAENVAFIGTVHWYQGNLDAASDDFRRAEAMLADAMKADATDTKLVFQKQIVANNLGHVLESRGQLDAALKSYQDALALASQLVASRPDKVDWVVELGGAHNNLGKIALTRGDLMAAIAEYSADDRIETELSARDPRNNDQRQNVFRVRAILARTLALAGQTDVAVRDFREAIGIAEELKKQDSANASIRENAALYKAQLSRLLRLSGELPEAAGLTDEALTTFVSLTRQDPANASWQRELAEVRTERAAQLGIARRVEALEQVRTALAWLNPAFEKRPTDRALLLATMNARLLLATVADEPEQGPLREGVLQAVNSVEYGAADPRVVAVNVAALLALGRKGQAEDAIRMLRVAGYRDPGFVAAMRQENIDYPIDAGAEERIRAAVSGSGVPSVSLQ